MCHDLSLLERWFVMKVICSWLFRKQVYVIEVIWGAIIVMVFRVRNVEVVNKWLRQFLRNVFCQMILWNFPLMFLSEHCSKNCRIKIGHHVCKTDVTCQYYPIYARNGTYHEHYKGVCSRLWMTCELLYMFDVDYKSFWKAYGIFGAPGVSFKV